MTKRLKISIPKEDETSSNIIEDFLTLDKAELGDSEEDQRLIKDLTPYDPYINPVLMMNEDVQGPSFVNINPMVYR